MGGWIRLDKDLEDDPRVEGLAALYAELRGVPKDEACNAVIGGLYRLWRYGDTHLGRHNRIKGALHGLAQIQEVTALPALLLERFPSEWLRMHADGSVELPDYAAKNALIDRDIRRQKGRERVRKFRERRKLELENSNALPTVTSKTLHRYKNVTTGTGPGPVTETGTSETGTGPVAAPLAAAKRAAATPREPSDRNKTQRSPQTVGQTVKDVLAAREKPPEGRAATFEAEFKRRFGSEPE